MARHFVPHLLFWYWVSTQRASCSGDISTREVNVCDRRIRLQIRSGVHFDDLNMPLFASAVRQAVKPEDSVVDIGCGTGILSVMAAACGASFVHSIDISRSAVDLTASNMRLNNFTKFSTEVKDIFQLSDPAAFALTLDTKLVLMNPPQTAGPPLLYSLRPDKYGGEEGTIFYEKLANFIRPSTRVLIFQISLANRDKIRAAFHDKGFHLHHLDEQKRTFIAEDYSFCPGLFEHLIKLNQQHKIRFHDLAAKTDSGMVCDQKPKYQMWQEASMISYQNSISISSEGASG